MKGRPGRRAIGGTLAALLLLLTAACTHDQPTSDDQTGATVDTGTRIADKQGDGEVRTDLAPLTRRFDALGEPVSAVWQSGTMSGGDAPGPSTYWIDAVVTLTEGQARTLNERYDPHRTQDVPNVTDAISAHLPGGPLLTGKSLNQAFRTSRFAAQAYLDLAAHQVVLVAVGQ